MNEWIKKIWNIYTVESYSAIKRNEILPFATMWVNFEDIKLSEISHTEKDTYQKISLIEGM